MTINAYIDAANLHQGTKVLDWEFDYARFRIWLKQKYQVQNAYLFIGLLPYNKSSYLLRKLNCPIVYLKGLSKQLEKRKSPQEGWLP